MYIFIGFRYHRCVRRPDVHSHRRRFQWAHIRRRTCVLLSQMWFRLSRRQPDQSLGVLRKARRGHRRQLQHYRREWTRARIILYLPGASVEPPIEAGPTDGRHVSREGREWYANRIVYRPSRDPNVRRMIWIYCRLVTRVFSRSATSTFRSVCTPGLPKVLHASTFLTADRTPIVFQRSKVFEYKERSSAYRL